MKSCAAVVFSLVLATASFGQSEQCRTTDFTIKLDANEVFSRSIGSSLRFRLLPFGDQLGWIVMVSPESENTQDWTYPVNMPLRTGEAQLLGSGYSTAVGERLRYRHWIRFLLTASDFARYSRMADHTLEAGDASTAGRYFAQLRRALTGSIQITPLDSETSSDGKRVSWARLRIQVTVPDSFTINPKLQWSASRCPPNWPKWPKQEESPPVNNPELPK